MLQRRLVQTSNGRGTGEGSERSERRVCSPWKSASTKGRPERDIVQPGEAWGMSGNSRDGERSGNWRRLKLSRLMDCWPESASGDAGRGIGLRRREAGEASLRLSPAAGSNGRSARNPRTCSHCYGTHLDDSPEAIERPLAGAAGAERIAENRPQLVLPEHLEHLNRVIGPALDADGPVLDSFPRGMRHGDHL